MKILRRLFKFLLFLIVMALIFHNWTARQAMSLYLRWALGTPVQIESARVDFLGTQVDFREAVFYNPSHVPPGVLAHLPLIHLDLDASSIQDGHLRFKAVELTVSDFKITRFRDGRINLFALKVMQPGHSRLIASKSPTIQQFLLRLERGSFEDDSAATPYVSRQPVIFNFKQEYLKVRTLEDMVKIISWEGLKRLRLEKLGTGVLDQIKSDLEG